LLPIKRIESPALVFALTLLVFWPCVHFDFVTYDDLILLQTPHRGLGWDSIRWLFTHAWEGNYTPLSSLTYAVDFALWGNSAFGYHLTNILFHAANAALFCLLASEFLALGGASAAAIRPAAFLSALLFSVHPLRIQSVAWIAERRDVLCGFFVLLTLLCWVRRWRGAALATFLCALLSKAAALPLPAVLLLIDVWPLRQKISWKRYAPFFILSAVFAAITLLAQSNTGAVLDIAAAAPSVRIKRALIGLVYYLGKALWPANLSLYEWHSWEPVRTATILGAAATTGLLFAARLRPALRRPILAALLFQTLMLLPVLGLVTFGHELVADRYSYLSGLGWALLAGAGLLELARRRKTASLLLTAVVVAALAASTRAQLPAWRNTESLWRNVLRVDWKSLLARPSLAEALFDQGRNAEAFNYLEDQLTVYPMDEASRDYLTRRMSETATTPQDRARHRLRLGLEAEGRSEHILAAWHFQQASRLDPQIVRSRTVIPSN
jgi:hypothetical protein